MHPTLKFASLSQLLFQTQLKTRLRERAPTVNFRSKNCCVDTRFVPGSWHPHPNQVKVALSWPQFLHNGLIFTINHTLGGRARLEPPLWTNYDPLAKWRKIPDGPTAFNDPRKCPAKSKIYDKYTDSIILHFWALRRLAKKKRSLPIVGVILGCAFYYGVTTRTPKRNRVGKYAFTFSMLWKEPGVVLIQRIFLLKKT